MRKNKLVLTALAAALLVSPMAKVGAEEVNPVQNQQNTQETYKVTVNYKLKDRVIKTETKEIKKGEKLNLDPSILNKDGKTYKIKENFVIPVINKDGITIDVPVTETIKATEILDKAITRYNVTVVYKLGDTPITAVPALVEKGKDVEVSDFEKDGKTYHVPNDYKKVKASVNHQVVIVPIQEIEKDKNKKDKDLHVHISYTLKGQEIKKEYKLLKKDSRFVPDLTELNKGETKYEVSKNFKAPDVIMENQLITVPVEEKAKENNDNKKAEDNKISDALGKINGDELKTPLNPEVVDEIKDIVKQNKDNKDNKDNKKDELGSKVHDQLGKLQEKDINLNSINKKVANEIKEDFKDYAKQKADEKKQKEDEKKQKEDEQKNTENKEVKKANPKDELAKTGIAATGIGSGIAGIIGIALSIFKKRK